MARVSFDHYPRRDAIDFDLRMHALFEETVETLDRLANAEPIVPPVMYRSIRENPIRHATPEFIQPLRDVVNARLQFLELENERLNALNAQLLNKIDMLTNRTNRQDSVDKD